MSGELKNKVALITGGGRGIGSQISRQLSSMGADTIICGRGTEALKDTVKAISDAGGKCESCICDVTDINSLRFLAAHIESTRGALHILVNNAGVGGFDGPLHLLAPETWDLILNTNLRGVYYCIASFLPLIKKALENGGDGVGHIVNISSIASKNPLPNGAAYAASKWGLNGLTYSVAEELRGEGIRVSLICPGSTDTALSGDQAKDRSKMLQPHDVAKALALIVTQPRQSFVSEIILRPTLKP